MRLRWAAAGAFVALSVGYALIARMGQHQPDAAELAKRCEESVPAWASYQEDIKGQIGAQPVAQWRGRPVEVRQRGNELTVALRLDPPWSDYEAAVPVLLRDPMGHERRQDRVERDGALARYVFHLDGQAKASVLPWVEIHYPHTERRIALNADGHWNGDNAGN